MDALFFRVYRNKILNSLIFNFIKEIVLNVKTGRRQNYYSLTLEDCVNWNKLDLLVEKLKTHQTKYKTTGDIKFYLDFKNVAGFLTLNPPLEVFNQFYQEFTYQFNLYFSSQKLRDNLKTLNNLDIDIFNLIMQHVTLHKLEFYSQHFSVRVVKYYFDKFGFHEMFDLLFNGSRGYLEHMLDITSTKFETLPYYQYLYQIFKENDLFDNQIFFPIRNLVQAFNIKNEGLYKFLFSKHFLENGKKPIYPKSLIRTMTPEHMDQYIWLYHHGYIQGMSFQSNIKMCWHKSLVSVIMTNPEFLQKTQFKITFEPHQLLNRSILERVIDVLTTVIKMNNSNQLIRDMMDWESIFNNAIENDNVEVIQYLESQPFEKNYNITNAKFNVLNYLLPKISVSENSSDQSLEPHCTVSFYFDDSSLSSGFHNDPLILSLFTGNNIVLTNKSVQSAIEKNYLSVVQYFYNPDNGLRLTKDRYGDLYHAMEYCHYEIAEFLLNQGPTSEIDWTKHQRALKNIFQKDDLKLAALVKPYTNHPYKNYEHDTTLAYCSFDMMNVITNNQPHSKHHKYYLVTHTEDFIIHENYEMVELILTKLEFNYDISQSLLKQLISNCQLKMIKCLVMWSKKYNFNVVSHLLTLLKDKKELIPLIFSDSPELMTKLFYFSFRSALYSIDYSFFQSTFVNTNFTPSDDIITGILSSKLQPFPKFMLHELHDQLPTNIKQYIENIGARDYFCPIPKQKENKIYN
ncbi:hypothetical protein DLAC_11128 [Tieghemostelium lacteum]|uniref:Ankyrin repeat-containing protein n=1 Tax=Tieghemostelium lacteum TaxID=361077 RepID=A0A151Z385_TIELA|nr:hypothetical protein DLAC_11128 [Tieghemostelium lacteum]|eukprot:KYQ88423.1 hypothetical protein DLAC_11128 [Tieghemostelium lacteum]